MVNVEVVTYTNTKKKVFSTPFAVKANRSLCVFQLPSLTETFKSLGLERNAAFISLSCNLSANKSPRISNDAPDWDMMSDYFGSVSNTFFPSSFETVTLSDPRIDVKGFKKDSEGQVSFVLTCYAIAPFIWVESSYEGRFNRNAFLGIPGESYAVVFKVWGAGHVDVEEFKTSLRVRSLWDTVPKTGCSVM